MYFKRYVLVCTKLEMWGWERERERDVHFFEMNKGSCYNERKVARGPYFNVFPSLFQNIMLFIHAKQMKLVAIIFWTCLNYVIEFLNRVLVFFAHALFGQYYIKLMLICLHMAQTSKWCYYQVNCSVCLMILKRHVFVMLLFSCCVQIPWQRTGIKLVANKYAIFQDGGSYLRHFPQREAFSQIIRDSRLSNLNSV